MGTGSVINAAMEGVAGLTLLRRPDYRRLAATLAEITAVGESPIVLPPHPPPSFTKSIATVPRFLAEEQFANVRRDIEALAMIERSYVPAHKKGGTIAYAHLIESSPAVVRLYHSETLRSFVSRTVGCAVWPTPLQDQSSLSILNYDRPGDHIGWHFDHNFYRGRHFTVLLTVVNSGRGADGLSHARLSVRIDGGDTEIPTPANTLVVFEGAKILHKASPILAGERRMVVSMTYCANPRTSRFQSVARRIKDIAFFGVRALWT
jgi:hypothetical protein